MLSNVIIVGAEKKLGKGILNECLSNPEVDRVLLISRDKNLQLKHPKIKLLHLSDSENLDQLTELIESYDSCFYCDRVSIKEVSKELYFDNNYTRTLKFAWNLLQANSSIIFCYVSAAGTDNLEQANQYSARINGKTENALNKLNFKRVYHFRPAIVQPLNTKSLVQRGDQIVRFFYPILRTFSKSYFLTFSELAKAMIYVSIYGYNKQILEIHDISFLANEGDPLV
ncbi:nucleoside-diphosphate sugar epimerase [Sphingobacterium sp. HJSM2_6]|uniref:nucleoside-diphosphate sugar epimerase n=1 Tax=Sphingobacterium sp. HJSM2_6 TaxID=3366264 RepID=UPI003BD87248